MGLTKRSVSIYAAEFFQDRTEVQCLHRWQKVLNPELIKGPWTQEVCGCSVYLTIIENYLCMLHLYKHFGGRCYIYIIFYRKMKKSLTLCASMDQQNGLSSQNHCLAA
jgi:hypothetical protein